MNSSNSSNSFSYSSSRNNKNMSKLSTPSTLMQPGWPGPAGPPQVGIRSNMRRNNGAREFPMAAACAAARGPRVAEVELGASAIVQHPGPIQPVFRRLQFDGRRPSSWIHEVWKLGRGNRAECIEVVFPCPGCCGQKLWQNSPLPMHVWLLVPPYPSINTHVWWVACLCTLTPCMN